MKKRSLILCVFLCVCLIGTASCASVAKGYNAGKSSQKTTVTTKTETTKAATTKAQETTAAPTPTPTPMPTPTPTPEPTASPAPTLTIEQKEDTYLSVTYEEYARNPSSHDKEMVKLSGEVVQVMEEESDKGTILTLRIMQNDDYETIWLVYHLLPAGASRILEGDNVKVYGISAGVYSYETVKGNSLTVPLIVAEDVIVKS